MNGAIEDVVGALGYLALGTRLKRLGERMQAQTQRILDAQGVAIPAGQFPFLAALDRLGALPVGALADAVGVTQPAATRSISQLARAGYVDVAVADDDQRRKSVSLSPRGARLVKLGKRSVWPLIEGAVRDVAANRRGSLLEQLSAIERALDDASLDERSTPVTSRRTRRGAKA